VQDTTMKLKHQVNLW